jgi:NADH-quinone oxidoreductase subunit J
MRPNPLSNKNSNSEHSTIDAMLTQILFYFFAASPIVSALMMVTRKNPVASALWLVGTFFSLAAIYTLLGAFFIGIIQILVYAGAIMVLFLFVIMLLNLGNDFEPDFRGTGVEGDGGGSALVLLALLARMWRAGPCPPLGDEAGPELLAAQVASTARWARSASRCSWTSSCTCRSPGCCCWSRWWARWCSPSEHLRRSHRRRSR